MRNERRTLLALVVVALGLRLTWVLSVSRAGFPFNDALFYHYNGYHLGHGGAYTNFGAPSAKWPPGYPALLAAVYRVFGFHAVVGELLNALLGAVTVPLLYKVVRPHFGGRVALIAAGMLAVMPGPILWTDMIVTETLYTFLLVVFLLLLMSSRPTWMWSICIGAYIGLVALTRSEGVMWLVLLPVLWRRQLSWRAIAPRFALAAAMVMLVLTPWTIRNYRTFDAFVPLSTNAGSTLWAGHNPMASGMQNHPSAELYNSFPPGTDWEVRSSAGLQRLAIDYMVHHPVRELMLIPEKIMALNRGDSYAFEWLNQEPYPTLGPVATTYISVAADFAWFSLLGLTLVGVVTLGGAIWRRKLMVLIAAFFIMLLVMYGFVYFGNYRYRLPYEPLMMVVAALVIDRGLQGLSAARARDAEGTGIADPEIADPEIADDAS